MLIHSKPLTAETQFFGQSSAMELKFKCTMLSSEVNVWGHSSQQNTQEQRFVKCSNISFQWRCRIHCSHSPAAQLLPVGEGLRRGCSGAYLPGPAIFWRVNNNVEIGLAEKSQAEKLVSMISGLRSDQAMPSDSGLLFCFQELKNLVHLGSDPTCAPKWVWELLA